jgi:Zn-dependent M28 family amino/carboxypeptidase
MRTSRRAGVICAGLSTLALLAGACSTSHAADAPLSPQAQQWWADIAAIADDSTEGRLTGSAGYMRAADHVIARFRALGLEPAGATGYLQPVAFEQQVVDQAGSRMALIRHDGSADVLTVGRDALISAGGARRPARIAAPLVFIGYGLHLPAQGHDDFAGVDLKGRIAVVISGGPADLPASVKSGARFARAEWLAKRGAVGLITLTTPHQVEIPWARLKLLAGQSGMYLADPKMRDVPDGFFSASIDPDQSECLFAGSGHSFAELSAQADASGAVPVFALPVRLRAEVAARHKALMSPNLIARLPGSDPALSAQHVVISAHLDHLGIGEPIAGDRIYNGAMDDASGVASVLDIAQILAQAPVRPRRSILFVIVTAEEKGLLGSHYFAHHPTVREGSIVADLNLDMPLPLWPLTRVIAIGEGESTLGADAAAVAAARGVILTPDPLPDRNTFIRTDLFSFVREGIPALAFKFGFVRGSPEFRIEHDWRANRYHAPSDDLQQTGVMKEDAVKLDGFVADVALRVASGAARPQWLPSSTFRPGRAAH